jgi:radical SAM protein (TIGR04043 family)
MPEGPALPSEERAALLADLQSMGLASDPALQARRGGAGPSDHGALSLGDATVMVPVRARSPFRLRVLQQGRAELLRDGQPVGEVSLPVTPRFYSLRTADGIPYSKIALLHSRNVLASTVLQTCVRYLSADKACRFCAIGSSLKEGRTLGRKSPAQLAEVAAAAVRLDGVEQVVLTTGTPASPDRGAAHLAACTAAIRAAVPGLPVQVQCEPPDDFTWFARLKAAGADTIGLHLEAVEPAVRAAVMPGKAEIPVERYLEAFAAAVAVFGRGQVSSYLLAGLGDAPDSLVAMADRLLSLGVYPFVVPFVPIAGTPLENRLPPDPGVMHALYRQVGTLIRRHGIFSRDMKAGCGKCGACSALSAHEVDG